MPASREIRWIVPHDSILYLNICFVVMLFQLPLRSFFSVLGFCFKEVSVFQKKKNLKSLLTAFINDLLHQVRKDLVSFTMAMKEEIIWVPGIGCFLKRFSINAKKRCNKKWGWLCRKMKIWHKYNLNVMFIFGWYGLLLVLFWWFWQWPNIMKTCSEIALCLRFL